MGQTATHTAAENAARAILFNWSEWEGEAMEEGCREQSPEAEERLMVDRISEVIRDAIRTADHSVKK